MRVIQVTYSGIDAGGYVWQNVFHITTSDDASPEGELLNAVADYVDTTITDALAATMCNDNTLLNLGVKLVNPATSYTFNKALNQVGTRDKTSAPGALAGRLAWYPETGTYVGHQFITGVANDDFTTDKATGPYVTLLQSLVDAFLGIDGTPATYHWRFVIFNRKISVAVNVATGAPLARVGVLSKRVRA